MKSSPGVSPVSTIEGEPRWSTSPSLRAGGAKSFERAAFLRILAVIGGVEALVMGVVGWLGIPEGIWRNVIDAGLLSAISAPFLYAWVVRGAAQRLSAQAALDLVQGLDAIVWEADAATWEFSFVSQGAEKVLGYPVELWLTKVGFWASVIHPEDRERTIAWCKAATAEGKEHEFEHRALAADGRVVWLREIVRVIRDRAGRARRLRGLMLDITERKRAEEALRDTSETMKTLIEAMPDAVFFKDGEGRWMLVNSAGLRLFELEEAPYQGKSDAEMAEVRPCYREALLTCARTDEQAWERRETSVNNEEVISKPDGGVAVLETIKVPLFNEDGSRKGLVIVGRDVSDRRRAEAALRESEERFRDAFANAPIGMALQGIDGHYLQVNRSLCEMLGYSEQELLATTFQAMTQPDDLALTLEAKRQLLSGEDRFCQFEKRYLHRLGHAVWAQMSISLIRDTSGNPLYFISQAQDISERKRFEAQLVHLAERDPLTDLFNRRRFQEELARELAKARRYGAHGAVMFLDLDDFKDVNDSLGHSAGDKLLRRAAVLLRERLRKTDTLARLGGDEFAVLLPQADARQAQVVAQHIMEAVGRHAIRVGGQPVGTTISIGIALFPEHGTAAHELLARADLAMYQAKENGRNSFHVYTPDRGGQAQIASRLKWKRRIREALEKDRFLLHCQPILDLRTDRVAQYELLVRMAGDKGEIVPPSVFLGVAERFGLIHLIDRWVVRRAIHLIAAHQRAGRDLHLGVNLSGKAFADNELLPMIRRELAETDIDPARLVLEITETAAVADISQAQEFIHVLKAMGCRFALDDFGAGFSSFAHLKDLPVDYLKIDGSFIRNLPRDEVDQHLVRAMVAVARGLGKRTIAEFVGDEETVRLLREFGVDYAQGYHIGRPAPVAEVLSNVMEEPEQAGRHASPRGGQATSLGGRADEGRGAAGPEREAPGEPTEIAAREAAAGRES